MMGVPADGELVVPMATHPVPPAGQTNWERPVTLDGRLTAVQVSTPPVMTSLRTAAPAAVVPIATQSFEDGHVISVRLVTPVRAVASFGTERAPVDPDWSRMTPFPPP
jgi:hypothetical protein